jgi:hypothetical protein
VRRGEQGGTKNRWRIGSRRMEIGSGKSKKRKYRCSK